MSREVVIRISEMEAKVKAITEVRGGQRMRKRFSIRFRRF